jgi:hypothetical protein
MRIALNIPEKCLEGCRGPWWILLGFHVIPTTGENTNPGGLILRDITRKNGNPAARRDILEMKEPKKRI